MSEPLYFRVLDIVRGTVVDGPGFRTAIYLSGCSHGCPGCHNPQSHDPQAGVLMSLEEIMDIVREEDFDVTLTGGDPLFFPEKVLALASAVKAAGYGLWLYTGYTLEEIQADPLRLPILDYVDVLVDGQYIESLRDPDLPFRGSSNQRLIPSPALWERTRPEFCD